MGMASTLLLNVSPKTCTVPAASRGVNRCSTPRFPKIRGTHLMVCPTLEEKCRIQIFES